MYKRQTYGRATVVVTATGMETELGRIAALMNATQQRKTPLQQNLDSFSGKLAVIILIVSAIVFGLSLYRQMPLLDALMFAVALAVAAIPEALSSIVTIVLEMCIRDSTALEPNGALAELFDLIGRMRNEDERRARVDHFLHFALAFLLEQKVPDRKDFVYNEDVRHNHRRN